MKLEKLTYRIEVDISHLEKAKELLAEIAYIAKEGRQAGMTKRQVRRLIDATITPSNHNSGYQPKGSLGTQPPDCGTSVQSTHSIGRGARNEDNTKV